MAMWNWVGRYKDGKVQKSFTNGCETLAELRDHVTAHFPGLEFVRGEETGSNPAIVMPMPAKATEYGIKAALFRGKPRII